MFFEHTVIAQQISFPSKIIAFTPFLFPHGAPPRPAQPLSPLPSPPHSLLVKGHLRNLFYSIVVVLSSMVARWLLPNFQIVGVWPYGFGLRPHALHPSKERKGSKFPIWQHWPFLSPSCSRMHFSAAPAAFLSRYIVVVAPNPFWVARTRARVTSPASVHAGLGGNISV